ncbi:MAG: hypothetical protein M1436_04140 [Acidobacteria bacterium]|nr:hypothetical protein [Acidobacteriota bacterium]
MNRIDEEMIRGCEMALSRKFEAFQALVVEDGAGRLVAVQQDGLAAGGFKRWLAVVPDKFAPDGFRLGSLRQASQGGHCQQKQTGSHSCSIVQGLPTAGAV